MWLKLSRNKLPLVNRLINTILPTIFANCIIFDALFNKNCTLFHAVSDFAVGKYTFKVGGRKKGQHQIKGVADAYVVKDDIEYGYLNEIPLWAFGLLY